ncbi:MAG: IS4 family transposase [Acidobacteria bacterium]|nr:IS4 family transposase [Acidobacteriota bacterium]
MLTPEAMQAAASAAKVTIGASPLNACTLVWLGIVGALHTAKNFADVLVITWKLLEDAQCPLPKPPRECRRKRGKRSKHDPRGKSPRVSEEAFVQARQKLPLTFWLCLVTVLAENFQRQHPEHVGWKRYRLLMLDGSDIALPRWKRLLDYYGAAGGGHARTPQARMLMLALAQSRLPWRYSLVPQSCHEQTAAKGLLQHLEANDLVLMDRGFWSYGLFWQIQRQQAFFAIRLRRGVKFRRVQRLGHGEEVVEWTPSVRSRKRCSWIGDGLPKSIRLRVVHYRVPGFRPSAVVTNVLDPRDVSRDEWVRMASTDERGAVLEPGLYHRRWDIETLFYELKVFQGLEGSLRSRTPEGIEFEIAGHVLLYFLIRWLMVEAAVAHDAHPLRLSFKHALQEFDDLRPWLLIASPHTVRNVLLPRLLARIAQHRILVRPGRHFPRLGDKYQLGKYRTRSKINARQT